MHGIVPQTIQKGIRNVIEATKVAEEDAKYFIRGDEKSMDNDQLLKLIDRLSAEMKDAAANLQFERAAELRDKITELKGKIK